MVVSSPNLVFTTDLTGQEYKDFDAATRDWNNALGKRAVRVRAGLVSKNPDKMDGIDSVTIGDLRDNELGKTYIKTETGATNKHEVDIVIDPVGDRNVFRTIALHEIGHALGADHTSGSDTIMNPVIELGGSSRPQTKITEEDVNAVKRGAGSNIDYLV